MGWLALAGIACFVLYLVDKNHKWRAFGKIVAASTGLFIVVAIGFFLYTQHQDKIANRNRECAAKIRTAYPGAYDDLDDATLAEKAIAKYPNCKLPPTPDCTSGAGDVFDRMACEDAAERKKQEEIRALWKDVPDSSAASPAKPESTQSH
jgi:hypothetical protein